MMIKMMRKLQKVKYLEKPLEFFKKQLKLLDRPEKQPRKVP